METLLASPPQKLIFQYLSRGVLGLLTCLSLSSLCSSLPLSPVSKFSFVLICVTQPHLLYYSTRPLPNTFALILSTFAFSNWFRGRYAACIFLLVSAVCTCRCDILVLAAPIGLSMLATGGISFFNGIIVGIAATAVSLAVAVPLDTVMWNNYAEQGQGGMRGPLWAEGVVLFYNTVENKSSKWGTSPWWWYFGSALPKALAGGAVFALMSVVKLHLKGESAKLQLSINTKLLPYTVPAVAFVALYSILPHKEFRFILPAVPLFNVAAADGLGGVINIAWGCWRASGVGLRRDVEGADGGGVIEEEEVNNVEVIEGEGRRTSERLRKRGRRNAPEEAQSKDRRSNRSPKASKDADFWTQVFVLLLSLGSAMLLLLSFLFTCFFLYVSHHNYPGGQAVTSLHTALDSRGLTGGTIHVCNKAAMTGLTRFLERPGWVYVKEGYEQENKRKAEELMDKVDFAISEDKERQGFNTMGVVKGYAGIDWRRGSVKWEDSLYILERAK